MEGRRKKGQSKKGGQGRRKIGKKELMKNGKKRKKREGKKKGRNMCMDNRAVVKNALV